MNWTSGDSQEVSSRSTPPAHPCRVCRNECYEPPLLRYGNMPRVAQFLPGPDSVELDKGVDLEVCQCSGCGLVQLSNDPVPYYRDVIRAAGFSDEMKSFRSSSLTASWIGIHSRAKR